MALLHEGAPGHEVLAPGGHAEAQAEQADTEGDRLPLGLVADPVGDAEPDAAEDADDQGHGGHRLCPPGVPGVGLQMGVVEGGHGQRAGRLVGHGLVAHVRSPIQKQTSMRAPTPISRPTNPSPTGPMPPRPNPPRLTGCWM